MADTDGGIERRRFPRAELRLLVQYRFETLEEFMQRFATNISRGGIFLETADLHDEGEVVFLRFALADGMPLIEAMARVVRVTPHGMGLEFLNMDDDSRALIEDICLRRASHA